MNCGHPVKSKADWAAVLFALGLPTAITWIYFVALAQHPPDLQQAAYLTGKVVQFVLPLVWVLLVQKQRLQLRFPHWSELGQGALVGGAIVAAMLALYFVWFQHATVLATAAVEMRGRVDSFGLHGPGPFIAMALFYSLIHSLLEEYYWRWFVFGQLRRLTPLAVAVLVSSLGFMAHHVLVVAAYFGTFSLETVILSLSVAVGGAIWACMYQRTGSLYATWTSHLLVDAGIFAVGYDMLRQ